MKKILTGIVIGSTLSLSAVTFAEPIKEYILTQVNYPIIVDGTEYKSGDLPILNYQGSTYVPLRAMSDLLEADMEWHKEAKIIEINKRKLPVPTPETNDNTPKEEDNTPKKEEFISLKVGETYKEGKFSITLERAFRTDGVFTCHFSYENDEEKSIEAYTFAEVTYGHDNPNFEKSTSGSLWSFPGESKVFEYRQNESGYLSFKFESEINKTDLNPVYISLDGNNGKKVVWDLQGL